MTWFGWIIVFVAIAGGLGELGMPQGAACAIGAGIALVAGIALDVWADDE